MFIKGTKIQDLTGQVFGDISVTRFIEKRGKHPVWDVVCNVCGKQFKMQSTHLKNKIEGKGCGVGCIARRNVVVFKEGIAYVDVSTDTFPDKICTVSEDNYHKYMLDRRWFCCKDKHSHIYYVYAKHSGKKERLHHLVLPREEGMVTDHIDGNGLNNLESNLRSVTHSVNLRNKAIPSNNTHGELGITLRPSGRYGVYIYSGVLERVCIGTFDTLEEAKFQRKYHERLIGTYHENNGRYRDA